MELVLRSDNRNSLAKIIAFARKLNISVEEKPDFTVMSVKRKKDLINRILNYKAASGSSFGDAAEWQRKEREDRSLPF